MTPPIEAQLNRRLDHIVKLCPASQRELQKAEILDLIAHLASEAKPEKYDTGDEAVYKSDSEGWHHDIGFNAGVDIYHHNFLRLIGRET